MPTAVSLAAGAGCGYPGTSPTLSTLKVAMANAASIREEAEALAIGALGFLASDPELLPRFLAITGIEASSIRTAAREPGFLAGVLQFILAHEPTLLRFAEETGTPPAAVGKALRALPTGDDNQEF
jgi:hypothetical protein